MSRNQALTMMRNLRTLVADVEAVLSDLPEEQPTESGETAEFVTETLFCKRTGYTTDQLRGFLSRPDIILNVHYRKPPAGKRTWSEEAMMQWQAGQYQSLDTKAYNFKREVASISPSNSKINGCGSEQAYQQRLKDLKKQQGSGKRLTDSQAKTA